MGRGPCRTREPAPWGRGCAPDLDAQAGPRNGTTARGQSAGEGKSVVTGLKHTNITLISGSSFEAACEFI